MADVFDVAAYILERGGKMTTLKLQKLVYYCQAWVIAWKDFPLFPEQIQAWIDGPVCPILYKAHQGHHKIDRADLRQGDSAVLIRSEIEAIDAVLAVYGKMAPESLSVLTHQEAPWLEAREGLPDKVQGTVPIMPQVMANYYRDAERAGQGFLPSRPHSEAAIAGGYDYGLPTSFQSQIESLDQKIDRTAFLGKDWNGEGAEAPNTLAREHAKLALSLLPIGKPVPSRVAPSVEGGIAFTWRVEHGDSLIEFYNDGDIVALISDRTNFPATWDVEVNELKSTLERLVSFVYG